MMGQTLTKKKTKNRQVKFFVFKVFDPKSTPKIDKYAKPNRDSESALKTESEKDIKL